MGFRNLQEKLENVLSLANFFVIGIYASISNESRSAFYMTKNDFEVASLGICVGLLFKVQIF